MSSDVRNETLDALDAALSSGDSLPPPEALLTWYLLSLANKELGENEKLEISNCLKEEAQSELQDRSGDEQANLDIEKVEEYLSKYYQGT